MIEAIQASPRSSSAVSPTYAAHFADHIIALKAGKVVLNGTPDDLMQPHALSRVYGLGMDVVTRPGRSPHASAL